MKILVDARSLGQKPSGIGMYIYNFVLGIEQYGEDQIALITDVKFSSEMKKIEDMGIQIFSYGEEIKKNFSLLKYYKFVQKCIDEYKPDVFWEGNNLFPIKLTNPYGKIVITIHDVFPVTLPECYGKVYSYYFRYGLHRTLKYTDAILYNSNDTKVETEKYFNRAKQKKHMISYIIVNDMPKAYISSQDYFLYIGNLEKRKGTDILIQAYLKYVENGGTWELHLGGKIREEAIEKQLEEAYKKTTRIKYLGYISEEDKIKSYAECGCFVFPSRAEGFGMPIVEVLHYAKPVIASDLSIFSEIAGNMVQKFALEGNEEQMVKHLEEQMWHIKTQDKNSCREVVERYHSQVLTEKLLQYFRMLAG